MDERTREENNKKKVKTHLLSFSIHLTTVTIDASSIFSFCMAVWPFIKITDAVDVFTFVCYTIHHTRLTSSSRSFTFYIVSMVVLFYLLCPSGNNSNNISNNEDGLITFTIFIWPSWRARKKGQLVRCSSNESKDVLATKVSFYN